MPSLQASPDIPDISDPALHWCDLETCDRRPGPGAEAWLRNEGSLTQLLIKQSAQRFRVEVVSEDWITIAATGLAVHFGPVARTQRFWSRKVVLLGNDEPWVAAHTLIPEHSLFSPLRQVLELNERPLGEYLFSHPQLLRAEMDFAPLPSQAWGRRSLFFLFQKPIMVAEFFLPALLDELQ